ncbi:MAG: hypothetical protein P9L97_11400, partial [Candidatus Tenebribacter davisii]|nr:hypothetical protein [Candidatus Tenebribacter davisii]
RKAPIAAISLISPPPSPSLPVVFWKIKAVPKNSIKPDKEPITAEIQLTSVFGRIEKIKPITINGIDNLSGIIE